MSNKPNGSHLKLCRFCGERYLLTNYMKRQGGKAQRGPNGELLNDTHLIACARKSAAAPVPPPAARDGKDGEE